MHTTQPVTPSVPAGLVADTDITAAIETLLVTKKGLSGHLIAVRTHDGVVALTSFTNNLLAQQRAEEIALAVRGVRGVRGLRSTLAVLPPATS